MPYYEVHTEELVREWNKHYVKASSPEAARLLFAHVEDLLDNLEEGEAYADIIDTSNREVYTIEVQVLEVEDLGWDTEDA